MFAYVLTDGERFDCDIAKKLLKNYKLTFLVADTDDDNYRPSKRTRADFRPPSTARSFDDTDAMQSSPGRSQRGHSREDVPMTDQTDDDPYEVSSLLLALSFFLLLQNAEC